MYNPQWAFQPTTNQMLAAVEQHQMLYRASPPQTLVLEDEEEDDPDDEKKRTLFCAGLDERVTEELLFEVFLQAGPVESVRIPKDNSGRLRGFGFVTYMHQCSIAYAMHLFKGLALFRKTLVLKYENSSAIPPLKAAIRALPSDFEVYQHKRHREGNGSSYDNSALRGASYAAYGYDPDSSGGSGSSRNPFSCNTQEWTGGTAGRCYQESNERGRGSRRADRERDRDREREREHDRERGHHGNDFQRNQHNNGGNRRSEQRSIHRR